MSYFETFKQHYREWFRRMELSALVAYEDNLSRLIDSDLIDDCILSDEIMTLYEIVRDECVCRCRLHVGSNV